MFAYNPTQDRSAEILTNANNQAAEIQLAGMQSLGNSIAAMGESAAKAYDQAGKNQMTSDYLNSIAGHLSNVKRPGTQDPYLTAQDLEKVSKGSLGAKQAIVSSAQALYEYDLATQRDAARYEALSNAYTQRAGNRANSGMVQYDGPTNLKW